jgi:hypothetical protein
MAISVSGGGAPSAVYDRTTSAYPNADNTGIPYGTTLSTWTGSTVFTTVNQTITAMYFPVGLATCDIRAAGVTFVNCCFNIQAAHDVHVNPSFPSATVTLQNCEFQGAYQTAGYVPGSVTNSSTVNGAGWTLKKCRIRGYTDGMHPDNDNLAQGCYVAHFDPTVNDHADGSQSLGENSNIVIDNCTILLDKTSEETAAFTLSTVHVVGGGYDGVTLKNSWLAAPATIMYPGEDTTHGTPLVHTTNFQVLNNVFSRELFTGGGVVVYKGGGGWNAAEPTNVWSGNTFNDGTVCNYTD